MAPRRYELASVLTPADVFPDRVLDVVEVVVLLDVVLVEEVEDDV